MRKRVSLKRALAVSLVLILMAVNYMRVDSSFATGGHLTFHYGSKAIETEMSDADLKTLKRISHGFSHYELGTPSCGFDAGVSVTLRDGQDRLSLCPACDTDEIFRIGESNRYFSVSNRQRRLFDKTVKKYGMSFPCI